MAEQKKAEQAGKDEQAPRVRLEHSVKWSGTLRIGGDEYPVKDGVVEVPAWHVAAARQSGFQPAEG